MERRLLLLRHGDAAQKGLGQSDHARPLTKMGETEVERISRSLLRAGLSPEAILASDAARTRATVQGLLKTWEVAPTVQYQSLLYLANLPDLRRTLALVAANLRTLMVVGHNPGLSELVRFLSEDDVMLDTAAAAYLTYEGETWDEAMSAQGLWTLEKIFPEILLS